MVAHTEPADLILDYVRQDAKPSDLPSVPVVSLSSTLRPVHCTIVRHQDVVDDLVGTGLRTKTGECLLLAVSLAERRRTIVRFTQPKGVSSI